MTLGDGKRKVCKLLDEYGFGGSVDEDLDAKMNDFFNMAQIKVAKISRILRTVSLSGEGSHPMPKDFLAVQRIWKNGRNVTNKCRWRGGELVLGRGESLELDYYAVPKTIDEDTGDEWEFEVREDACEAMTLYVAGLALSADLVQDAQIYFDLYAEAEKNLSSLLPGESHRVRNSLFG